MATTSETVVGSSSLETKREPLIKFTTDSKRQPISANMHLGVHPFATSVALAKPTPTATLASVSSIQSIQSIPVQMLKLVEQQQPIQTLPTNNNDDNDRLTNAARSRDMTKLKEQAPPIPPISTIPSQPSLGRRSGRHVAVVPVSSRRSHGLVTGGGTNRQSRRAVASTLHLMSSSVSVHPIQAEQQPHAQVVIPPESSKSFRRSQGLLTHNRRLVSTQPTTTTAVSTPLPSVLSVSSESSGSSIINGSISARRAQQLQLQNPKMISSKRNHRVASTVTPPLITLSIEHQRLLSMSKPGSQSIVVPSVLIGPQFTTLPTVTSSGPISASSSSASSMVVSTRTPEITSTQTTGTASPITSMSTASGATTTSSSVVESPSVYQQFAATFMDSFGSPNDIISKITSDVRGDLATDDDKSIENPIVTFSEKQKKTLHVKNPSLASVKKGNTQKQQEVIKTLFANKSRELLDVIDDNNFDIKKIESVLQRTHYNRWSNLITVEEFTKSCCVLGITQDVQDYMLTAFDKDQIIDNGPALQFDRISQPNLAWLMWIIARTYTKVAPAQVPAVTPIVSSTITTDTMSLSTVKDSSQSSSQSSVLSLTQSAQPTQPTQPTESSDSSELKIVNSSPVEPTTTIKSSPIVSSSSSNVYNVITKYMKQIDAEKVNVGAILLKCYVHLCGLNALAE